MKLIKKVLRQFKKNAHSGLSLKTFLLTALATATVMAPLGVTQAIEVDANTYQAFYGDVNGDGLNDIYLTPKPQYIPIAGEVTVIIPLAGEGNSYKLLAQASGYDEPELDNTVDTSLLSNTDFQLLSGDFNGDGVEDTFVQSTSQSLLSLTLANNLVEDSPYLLQTFASFASDTHNLTISDLNADGRDDISYTVTNQSQSQILYASNLGHLQSAGQGQVSASYGYDYLNKRRYKVVEKIGEPRQEVIYIDDHTELRDGKLQKYITLGGQKIARSSQVSGEFAPAEFYLNNHLGSIALTLDATAQVKNAFTYEPYGDKQIAYGETDLAPYGFTGKEQDPETQLGYFHHRYLNSKVGQFITPDPVFAMDDRFTDPQLWSPYAYARNNPIIYRDPDGQIVRLFVTGAKIAWKTAKHYKKTGKVKVDEVLKDELIGIVDDVNTLASDDSSIGEKFGAGLDLLTGLETTDGEIREALDVLPGKKNKGPCCFVAGTKILTKDGHKNIEDIQLGDLVLSKNVETGEQAYKPVTHLFKKYREIYELSVSLHNGETQLIETTDDHPFYVIDKGFVDTVSLNVGDKIETDSLGWVVVESVNNSGRTDFTYNFEADEFHTYYATKFNLLVHNKCGDKLKLPKNLRNKLKRINNQSAAGGYKGVTGSVSKAEVMLLGKAFVGPGSRLMSTGQGFVSKDGLRTFRFPKNKSGINRNTQQPYSKTGYVANFEVKDSTNTIISDVHIDVKRGRK